MDDFIEQVANNTANRENTQRRALLVHTSSEEHSAETEYGSANLYFATDHLLIQMTEFKFKLIFNDGVKSGGEWTDAEKGINMYPTLQSWFARWPLGSKIDADGIYGCQCVDYAKAFWWAEVNRLISTDGTGYAWGIWDAAAENAGTEFDLITKWSDLEPGDWVVWGSSTFGHIGIVHHIDSAGVHFWSQNYQNSSSSVGSPLSEDIIGENSGGLWFKGAFRYKKWHEQ